MGDMASVKQSTMPGPCSTLLILGEIFNTTVLSPSSNDKIKRFPLLKYLFFEGAIVCEKVPALYEGICIIALVSLFLQCINSCST